MGRASRRRADQRAAREQAAKKQRDAEREEEAVRARIRAAFGTDVDAPLTLIVDTPEGPYARRVEHALPLPADMDPGLGTEEATARAASTWGLPDFVYRSTIRPVGSGRRELGDCLLLVGRQAAVVQIKSRQGTLRDAAGEQSWIRKNAAKAARQSKGTVRSLIVAPAEFINGRGRQLTVDGNDYRWLAVVVIDHPEPPDATHTDLDTGDLPVVALLRRDWDFLFNQLRSTRAVLDYLFRVAALPPRPLGDEPVRYYELAHADFVAPPTAFDSAWLGPDAVTRNCPTLPREPMGTTRHRAHTMIRLACEDIANSPLPDLREHERLQALADIDALPVALRSEWGELLVDMLFDVADVPDDTVKWRFRRFLTAEARQLVFGAATRYGEDVAEGARCWVHLRHHEFQQAEGLDDDRVTLLVLLTPRRDGLRLWDTSVFRVAGATQPTSADLDYYHRFFPRQPAA